MSRNRTTGLAPVYVSLLLALMLSIMPLPAWFSPFRPDFIVVTLVYWSMMLPHKFSIGKAWMIGILLDVMQGTIFGQHALALGLVIFLAIQFHLRIRVFPIWQVSATVFALLSIYQFLLFWINGVIGVTADPVHYWGPVLTGSLIWPIVSGLLGGIRQRVIFQR